MAGHWSELLGWDEEKIEEIRFFGFSLLREGKYERARLIFEVLLILDKDSILDRQNLGALYLQMNENQKAVEQFNKVLEKLPEDEQTLLNKAKALFMLHQNQAAIEIVQKLSKSTNVTIANDADALMMVHA